MNKLPVDTESFIAPSRPVVNKFEPEKSFSNPPVAEIGFTSGGNPSSPCPVCEVKINNSDNPECFAKKLTYSGNQGLIEKYFVKINKSGTIFDPWGMYSEGMQNKFAVLHGRNVWEFREVTKKTFDFYKMFLQTRNNSWRINAEREFKNG